MSKIDRAGTFRGKVLDRSIGESKNGCVQLTLQLQASQLWDETEKVWVDWNYDEVDIYANLYMSSKASKETRSAEQVKKAFGWDGYNVIELQTSDQLRDEIQFRVEEDTYEGNTTLKVNWIDAYDATPGRSLEKLDKTGLAKIQAKWAGVLAGSGKGPVPKSAPPSAPKPAAKPKEEPKADPTPPAAETATPISSPVGVPPTSSEPPAPPMAEKPKSKAKAKPIDMNTAWQQAFEVCSQAGKTQLEITQAWAEAVKEAGGPDKIGDDWSEIAASTTAALS
jgi:hypothetical protein